MNTPNDGMYPGTGNGSTPNGNGNGNGHGIPIPEDFNGANGAFQPQIARAPQPAVDLARLQRMAGDGEEKSKVNVLDYLWLLWRGKWIILTCLLIAGLAVELMLIALLIYVPPFSAWFEHLPLPGGWWALLAAYPMLLYGFERIRKFVARRLLAHGVATS